MYSMSQEISGIFLVLQDLLDPSVCHAEIVSALRMGAMSRSFTSFPCYMAGFECLQNGWKGGRKEGKEQ